jgi:hypothetical protein
VQAGPLEIWRDNDRDNVADYGGPVSKGQFGINIHHAGVDSKQVGLWSAGCQVFKRTADHAELLSLCDRQAERGPSWANFSYTLVHLADAPELTPVALPIA